MWRRGGWQTVGSGGTWKPFQRATRTFQRAVIRNTVRRPVWEICGVDDSLGVKSAEKGHPVGK